MKVIIYDIQKLIIINEMFNVKKHIKRFILVESLGVVTILVDNHVIATPNILNIIEKQE